MSEDIVWVDDGPDETGWIVRCAPGWMPLPPGYADLDVQDADLDEVVAACRDYHGHPEE